MGRYWSAVIVVVCLLASGHAYCQEQIQTGYTLLTPDPGSAALVGSALFSYTNARGVLVSQAGVASATPIPAGRIFVDQSGTETGIALVNPSGQSSNVIFVLRDASGKEAGQVIRQLSSGSHLATFVSQLFTGLPDGFIGSLTFESDQKLASITLRQTLVGEDPLYTTLPVVDPSLAGSARSIVFPQIAAGGGYQTQLILINTTDQKLTGRIVLTRSDGQPLLVSSQGAENSQFSYQIEPQGVFRAEYDRPEGLDVGYAVLTPDEGTSSPSGSAIFQFRQDSVLVTEAGVGATTSTTAARIFVDNAGSYTGVAVANPSDQEVVVTFTIMDRFGSTADSSSRTLPPRGHLAIFAHELVPGLPDGFTGLLEIDSTSPVVPITLKLSINSVGNQILTTLPVADLDSVPPAESLIFSHIAIGQGFATRLIFINAERGKAAGGTLSYFQSNGAPLIIPQGGTTGSQFSYQMVAGGGRQFLPGDAASVASISLLERLSDVPVSEVTVNAGQSYRPSLLVLDTAGHPRDDFELAFSSLSTDVATVDKTGQVEGMKAGFSTLTISSGNVVATSAITVVAVNSGVTGFEITGIAQDLARRIYLANSKDNTILLAQNLAVAPNLYAGVPSLSGLKDDVRLQSLFRGPSFLAFDQVQANLYVSDAANNVIRRVHPGVKGRVETFAGSGEAGARDGALTEATFNNPQGIALDTKGNLWVVDSGNHVIRRIDLTKGTVETIAGVAGSAGFQDGKGSQARFDSPTGIAPESEPLAHQLERLITGEPPPPVSFVVADTGNGVLRRVRETGEVETIRSSLSGFSLTSPMSRPSNSRSRAEASSDFDTPTGVYVDAIGSIYVSEPAANRVRVILRTGELVSVSQANTFKSPRGIVATQGGRVIIADSDSSAREISYGAPQIAQIFPDHVSSKGGDTITISGKNFAPETILVVGNTLISERKILDSETISFVAPGLGSGRTTLSVQNRGGLAQQQLIVDNVPLLFQPAGYITTVAGGSTFAGDGSKATEAPLSAAGITQDTAGNLFVVDGLKNGVRRIDAKTGVITSVAGNGSTDSSGDGGQATAAGMFPVYPGSSNILAGIAFDKAGNLYVVDSGRVRKITAATGIITTVAGGEYGNCGDGGEASLACLADPQGLAFDRNGNLFIADAGNHNVRRVDVVTETITTVAGTGDEGFSGDGGPAVSAKLDSPTGIAIDPAGNLYIADSRNYRIREIDAATHTITTIVGDGDGGWSDELGDGGSAKTAHIDPIGIALDNDGNLFIADAGNSRIRRVDSATGIITTVAGNGSFEFSGDGGKAADAGLNLPNALVVDAGGNVFIVDTNNFRIRKIDAATSTITTVGGNGQPRFADENGPAELASLLFPISIAFDSAGNLYLADSSLGGRVRKVDAARGSISTVAGGGAPIDGNGDGGPATQASSDPRGIAFDVDSNLYIVETFDNRIRRVDAKTGTISTIAGNGEAGFSGDGGPAAAATLDYPTGIALDSNGNLYISDSNNRRIRKVNLATGIISTVAGGGTPYQGIGDGGPATQALLGAFTKVAVGGDGSLCIVDAENLRLRKVDSQTQIITTVAGGGESTDEDIAATEAVLYPIGVTIDKDGNLFVIDESLNSVRRIDAVTSKIRTLAGGDYREGFDGDNGPAIDATFKYPKSAVFDSSGNLFLADTENHRIRAVRAPIP